MHVSLYVMYMFYPQNHALAEAAASGEALVSVSEGICDDATVVLSLVCDHACERACMTACNAGCDASAGRLRNYFRWVLRASADGAPVCWHARPCCNDYCFTAFLVIICQTLLSQDIEAAAVSASG